MVPTLRPNSHSANSLPDEAFEEHSFEVPESESGTRLDDFLSRRLPLLSRTKLRSLVGAGAAAREAKRLSIGDRLRAQDIVIFRWRPHRVPPGFPERVPLNVVWEDEHLLAIDKPAGILVHPTRGVKRGTLANALLGYLNPGLSDQIVVDGATEATIWPRFIHRLDRETSGVVLVAKNSRTASRLGKALARGDFEKRYLAIAGGDLSNAPDSFAVPIARFDDAPPHWRASSDGQPAQTRLRIIAVCEGYSLCQLEPVTGRTNQLRIHCAYLGAPILGDVLYGAEQAGRTMLHAWRLSFTHPETGARLCVEAPLPTEFRRCWKAIMARPE